jgi:hypothetical protein
MSEYSLNNIPGIPEFFFPFSKLIAPFRRADGILAFIGLITVLRALKYLTLFDSFRSLIRVLERAFLDLTIFAGLLAVVIFGFSKGKSYENLICIRIIESIDELDLILDNGT